MNNITLDQLIKSTLEELDHTQAMEQPRIYEHVAEALAAVKARTTAEPDIAEVPWVEHKLRGLLVSTRAALRRARVLRAVQYANWQEASTKAASIIACNKWQDYRDSVYRCEVAVTHILRGYSTAKARANTNRARRVALWVGSLV